MANQSPGFGTGMGLKSLPGSNAFLRFSGSPSMVPMALSLSEAVGGLKSIANVTNKAKKIMIKKKVVLIMFKLQQFTEIFY
jgi:hypothetical protein